MKKLIYLVTILFFVSCGSNKETDSKEKSDGDKTPKTGSFVYDKDAVYLEGLYATSTMLPFAENSAELAFDNDPKTSWVTMKGAGPNEGMMLYFSEAVPLSKLEIVPAKGNGLAAIEEVTVFINGSKKGNFEPNSEIVIDKEVKSLFIKISQTTASEVINNDNLLEGEGIEEYVELFSSDMSAGISEIKMYSGEKLLKINAPVKVEGNVTASSILAPEFAYHPVNLFDSKQDVVWAEGDKGTGEGQSITFSFDKEMEISGIDIWNGYQRSDEHFKANAKIGDFVVYEKSATDKKINLKAAATTGKQFLSFPEPLKGKEFVMEAVSVTKGEKYPDMVISEMRLYMNNVPFVVSAKVVESRIDENLKKAQGTVLAEVLDRCFTNNYTEEMAGVFSYNRSIILRSDNTFVMYTGEYNDSKSTSDTLEIVADGNWEWISADGKTAKIRVFGKYASLTDDYGLYKGSGQSSYQKIFQDFVTITGKSIKGEKFVEEVKMGF